MQLLNPLSLEPMDTLDLGDLAPPLTAGSAAAAGVPQVVTALRFRPDLAASGMQNVLLVAQVGMAGHLCVCVGGGAADHAAAWGFRQHRSWGPRRRT